MHTNRYRGKFENGRKIGQRNKWSGICLLFLHLSLLAVCTVRIFSSGSADALEYNGACTALEAYEKHVFAETGETIRDSAAPVISGVKDITVYEGDTVAYLKHVTAMDDRDGAVEVSVDPSAVELNKAGTYEAVYLARDLSGNIATVRAAVTVLPKGDDYVDLDTIYAAADAVLEQIIMTGAKEKEQVGAIYSWAHESLRYGGHSDRADWRQTAYIMLTTGRGDCFGYFAVTKLLFERLSIPNIDVQKVKNHQKDSSHFWSMVSIDGGNSYFHFDATPRQNQSQDFCLVTDDEIDAYSAANKGSHNRDASLYPATPEERP